MGRMNRVKSCFVSLGLVASTSLATLLAVGCGAGDAPSGDGVVPDARGVDRVDALESGESEADAADDRDTSVDARTSDAADTAPALADARETSTDTASFDPALCVYPAACAGARYLDALSGDEAPKGNEINDEGYSSEWLVLDLKETSKSITDSPLLLEATLISPPGVNFDLYVYVADGGGKLECSRVTAQSTQASDQPEELKTSWDDSWSDDSRKVVIEVRHVSGGCDKSARWKLNVRGGPT
jgi:hypothetical protein